MKIDTASYDESPNQILEDTYDCIWVALDKRNNPSPLKHEALRELDWKLRGVLSRWIKDSGKGPTFVPTGKEIPSSFIALERGAEMNFELLMENCEGQKWRKVMIYCEDSDQISKIKTSLARHRGASYPEELVIATSEE